MIQSSFDGPPARNSVKRRHSTDQEMDFIMTLAPLQTSFAAALLLLVAGCSSGSMTSELAARPEPRAIAKLAAGMLRLPQDEKFSIALAPAQKSPGIMGVADANAKATHDGNADLSATVENGGTASATFQVGHAFANDSDRQMDLKIRLRFDYEYHAEARPAALTEDAVLGVDVFARSDRGKLLKTINVLKFSTAEGDVTSRGNKEADFVVTLAPADAASVFVGGNVQIAAQDGHSASATIKLSKLEMEIEPKSAPAIPAATRPAGP